MSNPLSQDAVLIVDDDPALRRAADRVLTKAGYHVLQAATARDARLALRSGGIGVVVLDVVLPDMNGLQLLRELQQENCEVDVVVVTGTPARWDMAEAIKHGASSYLRKPLDPFALEVQVAAAQHAHQLRREARARSSSLERALQDAQGLLEQLPRQLAKQLTSAWDLRHVETGAHVRRMAAYTELLARELGFAAEDATTLGQVAMLHDVGKLAIPDSILTKPGKLTAEEFELMKRHAPMGAQLLAGDHPFLVRAAQVALRHHERWNGSGYPGGLSGEQCPLDARIVGVADVYDALGQTRCYKPGWSPGEIEDYFRRNAGELFEPRIVDALLRIRPSLDEVAARLPDPSSACESGVLPIAAPPSEPPSSAAAL